MTRAVLFIGIGAFLAGGAVAIAESQAESHSESRSETTFERRVETQTFAGVPGGMGIAGQAGTFRLIGGVGLEGKVVKNAPYSAEGLTETSRTLSDGTKIAQKTKSKIYRDAEGKTRREQTLSAIGEWTSAGEPPVTITISNPAAGETYILNSKDKVAHKMKVHIEEKISGNAKSGEAPPADVIMFAPAGPVMETMPLPPPGTKETMMVHKQRAEMAVAGAASNVMYAKADAKSEALGERNIEGVMAQGKRTTSTIPVGKIGNDRPIQIVNETWYSPDLQAIVLSETKDPMAGDITYRLTNIQRTNPPAYLFEVPPDYKIQDGGMFTRKVEIKEDKQ